MKMIKSLLLAVFLLFSQGLYATPVNINTADAASLAEQLKGIGPKKAQAIVDYRNKNGAFTSIEDVVKVKGISEKTLAKNRDNIVLK